MARYRFTPLRLAATPWRGGGAAVVDYEPLGWRPPVEPGVFYHFWLPGLKSLPLAPVPAGDRLRFYVKARGPGTLRLVEEPPPRAGLLGPMGAAYRPRLAAGSLLVLVAGGTGLAALAPLAFSAVEAGVEVVVYHGVSSVVEAPPSRLLLPGRAGYRLATLDGSGGAKGTVVDAVDWDEARGAALLAAAGPEEMLCSIYREASRRGLLDRLVLALEATVKCGMGFCGRCRVPCTGSLLCRDGVFYPARSLSCWARQRCGRASAGY
ncbi:MAG: hypothetical protein GXO15_04870 [Crenarchaeota archaeon]|nr:hypothetical protein [Thermoproteota archaeon]